HAAVDVGVLRLIALVRVGVGWIELQILDRFGVSCPRNPLEDPKVRGLAQDLLRLLEVDTRKLNDDPVGPLGPDDRFGEATAVDPALDDVYRHVACLCGGHPGADVRDLELEVRATLAGEALVHA